MDQAIQRVAEQLGFQAARIWPQVVAVTWLTSVFWTAADPVIFVVCLIGGVSLGKHCWRQHKACAATTSYAASDEPIGLYVFSSLAIFCLGLVAMVALNSWPDELAGAIYPEAVTVMRLAKGITK